MKNVCFWVWDTRNFLPGKSWRIYSKTVRYTSWNTNSENLSKNPVPHYQCYSKKTKWRIDKKKKKRSAKRRLHNYPYGIETGKCQCRNRKGQWIIKTTDNIAELKRLIDAGTKPVDDKISIPQRNLNRNKKNETKKKQVWSIRLVRNCDNKGTWGRR